MEIKLSRRLYIVIYVLILAISYFYLLDRFNFFSILHLKTTDIFFRYRYHRAHLPEIANQIVIIDIDENTVRKLNQRWPMNRGFFSPLLKNLFREDSKPLIVGIDLMFTGKSDEPEADLLLAKALKESDNVIIASYFDKTGRLILPERLFLESAKSVGFIDFPRDTDLIIRRAYPFIFLEGNKLSFPFALEIFSSIKDIDLNKAVYDKKSQSLRLPYSNSQDYLSVPATTKRYSTRINYFAKFNDFKIVPFVKVLTSSEPIETFKDKIVLLGISTELYHDIHTTPFGLMPGIAVNGNFLMTILLNRFLKEIPKTVNFLIFFIVSLMISLAIKYLTSLKGFILSLGILLAGFYASAMLILKDIIFDFFGLSLIVLISFITMSAFKYFTIILSTPHKMTAEDLVKSTDKALYEAKTLGRNRVIVAR